MPTMMLLFSLLTPDVVERYATELFAPEPAEQSSVVIDEMLARFDAELEVEQALDVVDGVF